MGEGRHKVMIYTNNDKGTKVEYVTKVLLCLLRALSLSWAMLVYIRNLEVRAIFWKCFPT